VREAATHWGSVDLAIAGLDIASDILGLHLRLMHWRVAFIVTSLL
jgi:hypothetical protein